MKKITGVFLFFFCFFPFCYGEVIHLHNGGRIEGEILEWKEDVILVKTKWGIVKVLKDQIKSIDQAKSIADIYKQKLEKIERNDSEGYYKLGKWCQENKLEKEAEECFQKTIEIEPSHIEAHKALGHKYYLGKWLTYGEYMRIRGYVYYAGDWLTREEYNNRIQGMIKFEGKWMTRQQFEELRKQRLQEINWGYKEKEKGDGSSSSTGPTKVKTPEPLKPIEVPDDVKELLKMAKSSSRDKRVAAYKALQEKGGDALEALRRQLMKEKGQLKEKILDFFRSQGDKILSALQVLLEKKRKAAIDFIMDPSRYPEENHGKVAQPQVDELVAAVRQVWEHPFKEVIALSKALESLMKELSVLVEDLKTYGGLPESYDYEVEDLDKRINKAVSMEARYAPAGTQQILEYNLKVATSVDQEERSCILITNKYRIMLGRKPLKIDEPLVQAARKHSKDMNEKKYFSHTSQDGRNPGQRCAAEGASYYSGENIAMGMNTGEGAFMAWYTSSGHHRNMLSHHISIGVGRDGTYWTEDFGVSTSSKK